MARGDLRKARKKRKLLAGIDELEDAAKIFKLHIDFLTPYQYRLNNTLDIYPTNRRWHNLKTQKRGSYTTLEELIIQEITLG